MRKSYFLALLFLCMSFSCKSYAAQTLNWCGTYFEENERGYLIISQDDLISGSDTCSTSNYKENLADGIPVVVALDFTKNRSALTNWRKFNNHLLEVRGKMRGGIITSTRFVRDFGI